MKNIPKLFGEFFLCADSIHKRLESIHHHATDSGHHADAERQESAVGVPPLRVDVCAISGPSHHPLSLVRASNMHASPDVGAALNYILNGEALRSNGKTHGSKEPTQINQGSIWKSRIWFGNCQGPVGPIDWQGVHAELQLYSQLAINGMCQRATIEQQLSNQCRRAGDVVVIGVRQPASQVINRAKEVFADIHIAAYATNKSPNVQMRSAIPAAWPA